MTRGVIIVDDHPVLRIGVGKTMIGFGWDVIAEAGTAAEAECVINDFPCDLIILDTNLADKPGIELLRDLRKNSVKTPVLIFSALAEAVIALPSIKAGANGFINKRSSANEFKVAIERILSGRLYVSAQFAEILALKQADGQLIQRHDLLSERELQVLLLIANAKTPNYIACQMNCSPNTISTYRARILVKLDLFTNLDIMRYALKHQLVTL